MQIIQKTDIGYDVPPIEEERIRELYELELLGAGHIEQIDRICALARDLFKVPIALVNLIDRTRMEVLASSGADLKESSRKDAICSTTVLQNDPLVVPDARLDPRFDANAFVCGPPNVRFYAGVPLKLRPGINIGTICILDAEPRNFSTDDEAHLSALADMIISEIRGRRAARDVTAGRMRLQQTARMAKIGGWESDLTTKKLTWDDEIYNIYGIPQGTPPAHELVTERLAPGAVAQSTEKFEALYRRGTPFDVELSGTRPDGKNIWIRAIGDAEKVDGKVARVFGAVQDITARKDAEARIHDLAYNDTLTKLPNRAQFQEKLQEAIAASNEAGTKFGLLMLDLDHFKDVNDTFGHQAGDDLLCTVGERLRRSFRPIDTVARIGGDEFAAIVVGLTSVDELKSVADAMISQMTIPFQHEHASLSIGASVGYAQFPSHGLDAVQIMKNADIAMYRAKAQGRGRAVAFEPGMLHAIEARADLFQQIRAGIARGEFILHYQPIVALRSNVVTGLEALMRWNHPERGILAPVHFMAGLDDPDLSLSLGEVALDTSLKQMRDWIAQDVAFGRVSVNLSSAQFRMPDLADHILAKLKHWKVPANRLTLEVTENVYMAWGADQVTATVQKLHDAGVGISLDDFGTGYASLSHLRQFPIDNLKIDKSFVQSIESTAIVDAVINMGLSLGMKVVAEGVEDKEHLSVLRMKGCDFVQGFVFAKALDPARVSDFIAGFGRQTKTRPRKKARA